MRTWKVGLGNVNVPCHSAGGFFCLYIFISALSASCRRVDFFYQFPTAAGVAGDSRKLPERAKTKEKQMSTEKLSTGFELSTASLKKREGKKKPSSLNIV